MHPIKVPALPLPEPLRGRDPGSFAHFTVTERMPRIAREVLAENRFPAEVVNRLESLIEGIPDEPVRPLQDPGAPDSAEWQEYVQPYLGQSWLEIPWFFAEEYFYRRLLEATDYFQPGPTRNLDPFQPQKNKVLEASAEAIDETAGFLLEALAAGGKGGGSAVRHLYRLLLNSTWGNQGDLSIWSTHEERPEHNELEVQEAHLLVNQARRAADLLMGMAGRQGAVEMILDNCGPELVADLALVDYLLSANLAQVVRLQTKAHPTFVSDALVKDIYGTIEYFAAMPGPSAQAFGARLGGHLDQQRLRLASDFFWNSPRPFWEMPEHIRNELARSRLAISKGDANFRRLVDDRAWPLTSPFSEVVSYFPAPLATLRVLKSEVALGLPEGRAEQLDAEDPGWMVNGKWGVIHFVERAGR